MLCPRLAAAPSPPTGGAKSPLVDQPPGAAAARISGPVPAFTAACQDAMARLSASRR